MKGMLRGKKGITLIALVVTIVVLLILAAVSISMLTGENGIIQKAQMAKNNTEQARIEELVDLAVNSLITNNMGNTSNITPAMVAEEVNRMENRTDVYAEGDIFPTNIIFPKEKRTAEANLQVDEEYSYDGIYSVPGLEGKIASEDLFEYEIISDEETGATEYDTLPTKKARITKIKEKYCNDGGGGIYNSDTKTYEFADTNYKIQFDGITDVLVIPYNVELEGEMYQITEVNLMVGDWVNFPNINTIIYPNTVTKVYGKPTSPKYEYSKVNGVLKKIVLSNNLKEIPNSFFCYLSDITNITIPKSVTSIGEAAFYGCSSLTNIIIPNGVTNIENRTFSRCSSLKNIIISNSVASIGNYAFYDCSSLTNIIIPSSVTSIGDNAFSGCTCLTSITIPDSVTSIGNWAFYKCTKLTSITIPNSVTSIEDYTFYDCNSLADVTIQSGVTSIGKKAFERCSSLTNIIIPQSVTGIGDYAFSDCSSLVIMEMPDGLISIGTEAFYGCTSLTSITIPNSVASIGDYAFDSRSLININVDTNNNIYDSRNNCNAIIKTDTNELIIGCKNTIIPNNVTSIGNGAFLGCSDLANITIPNSVTSIGNNAFNGCTSLSSITIPNSVTSIQYYAFAYWTESQIINCEATKKPSGWHSTWDYYDNVTKSRKAQLNWGVT